MVGRITVETGSYGSSVPAGDDRGRRADFEAHEPRQGPVSADRVHQGRGDRVLPPGGRRTAATPVRPAAHPETLAGRHERVVLLREERTPRYAVLGADRDAADPR